MDSLGSALKKFFGVVLEGQTYLNSLYLLLAFPLGLFYFVFLVTGLSVGIGLVIVWVGVLILAGVFAAWYGMAAFERWLAINLLREEIPPMEKQDLSGMTLWQKFVYTLKNPVTWKGLAYLFARFPLGICSFVVLVTLVALSAALIAAPAYYRFVQPTIDLSWNGAFYQPWLIDTLPEALIACLAGLLIGVGSLHVFNGLAWVSGKFARLMLGNFSPAPVALAPVPAAVATPPVVVPPVVDEPSAPSTEQTDPPTVDTTSTSEKVGV